MFDRDIHKKLDRILQLLEKTQKANIMASQALLDSLTALQSEVASNTSATQAAETLINGFVAQLKAAVNSASDDTVVVAAVQDVISHFQANDTALARAVAANTPAGPSTPVPPIVAPAAPAA